MRDLSITLLGTGTSTGLPVIGCSCPVCTSDDPRDTRTRTSCHVQAGELSILIDAGPDLRRQALREGLVALDALLITHHHFDHIVGLDDLRPFFIRNKEPMPCYAHPTTARVLRHMFPYIFGDHPYPTAPKLELHEVEGPFSAAGRSAITRERSDRLFEGPGNPLEVIPIELDHGKLSAYGYRIGNFAYLTDAHAIPEPSYALLTGVEVLVVDALRERPHPTHFSFDEAIAVARRIRARQTYFVHMTHDVLHAEADARLPDGINLGYDGLSFNVE